jgi:predicted trehalose synthase
LWQAWVSAAFLRGYLEAAAGGRFLPAEREELSFLLQMHLVEKAIYEIGYELGSRKDWVRIPLEGVLDLVAPKA